MKAAKIRKIFLVISCLVGLSILIYRHYWPRSGSGIIVRSSILAMGTVVEVTVAHSSEEVAKEAIQAAFMEIERVERLFSSYESGSVVSKMNREAFRKPTQVNDEVMSLIKDAISIGKESGGAFDITIGKLIELWDFDHGGKVPEKQILDDIVRKVGNNNLIIEDIYTKVGFNNDGIRLDLGGIAKGWAVDCAVEKLKALGIEAAIVDAGGDLRLVGVHPGKDHWRIGVQHPREPGRLLLSFDLRDTAIVTSGDYERFFMAGDVKYHHILDPTTGEPARGCQSVTVIAATATEADACATAAFVLGPARGIDFLRSRPGVRGLIVDAHGGLHWTDDALARSARR